MPRPELRLRDTQARELMDEPDADRAALERTYRRFGPLNDVISGWRRLYRHRIGRHVSDGMRLLDVGSGGGDVSRALAGWLLRDGVRAEVVALDADARATAWASQQQAVPGVRYVTATSEELADGGEGFDVIVSNHLLHHLDGPTLSGVLADSERMLRPHGLALHADIARSRAAYVSFDILTRTLARPLLRGTFIREDGLTSIRRSFTPAELTGIVPTGWRVQTMAPHRLLLTRDGGP